MSPAWPRARAVLRLGGLTLLLLLLLLLCPQAARGDCSLPPNIPNAQPDLKGLTSFPEQSIITYKCDQGFVKIPGQPDSVVCLKNNEWSNITEFCNRSCNFPARLLFASLKKPYNQQNYFPLGSIVEYECRLGYKRDHSLSGKITCLQNFTWSKPDEFCKRKSCPNPGEITNGHINIATDILFGSSITFSCNTGYELVGETSSYCIIVGQTLGWSDPLPECKESTQIVDVTQTPQKPTTANIPATELPSAPQRPTTVKAPGTKTTPTPQKPTTANIPATELPSAPQRPTTVKAPGTKTTPTPQKPTTANIPATELPSAPQRPTTVKAPGTKTTPTPQKPTTANIPATELPSAPQRPTTVKAPGTKTTPTPQKPTTANIPATELPSAPQRPTTVKAPGTKTTPTPQKPTTANIPATELPPTPQKLTTVKAPATKATLTPQKPTTANIPATETISTPKKPTTINSSASKAPLIPQKPITTNDSTTTAKISPVSNALSTESLLAAQNPIMANTFATQAKVKQKFTADHALVTKGLHTTQILPSAHITATQSQAVPQETTPFQTRSTSKSKETLPVGASTIVSGLVAVTIIIGSLILVKVFWDYGKSGTHIYNIDCFVYDASNHWLADLAKEEIRRKYT